MHGELHFTVTQVPHLKGELLEGSELFSENKCPTLRITPGTQLALSKGSGNGVALTVLG